MTELLTKSEFIDKIFDFENKKEWDYNGDVPILIDFYADWCGPCKMLAPVLEQLSEEYDGKVKIYKVDTEAEQELSAVFGIRSIPSMLFCPVGEDPQMAHGALPKKQIEQIISDVLKVSK
ncbi:MAG: thioredoxin [Tenacibaculum sp.]|nr:thioredoxin [Tenacibaculum sp.]